MDRRQGVQVCHGELNPLPLQFFIYVYNTCEVRTAPKGICPCLGGERKACQEVQVVLPASLRPVLPDMPTQAHWQTLFCSSSAISAEAQLLKPWISVMPWNVNKLIKLNSACISLEKWQRNDTKSLAHTMMQAFAPSQGNQLPEMLKEVKTCLNASQLDA